MVKDDFIMTRLEFHCSALLEKQKLKTFLLNILSFFFFNEEASKYQKYLLLSLYVSLIYERNSTRLVSILFSREQGRGKRERGS